jgi:hypothetical protein
MMRKLQTCSRIKSLARANGLDEEETICAVSKSEDVQMESDYEMECAKKSRCRS